MATLDQIIEMSPADLLAERVRNENGLAHVYAGVLFDYLESNIDDLKQGIRQLEQISLGNSQAGFLGLLSELRLAIRMRQVMLPLVQKVEGLGVSDTVLVGEKHFVLALAYDRLLDHLSSKKHWQISFQAFDGAGLKKKAAKALFNFVAEESRIYPEKRLISEYHLVVEHARRAEEPTIEAIALLNVSREYQKLGAYLVALKHCDEALKLLRSDIGTLHHDLAVVHRAHLLVDLLRVPEARLEHQRAALSTHAEIRAAAEIVRTQIEKISPPYGLNSGLLTPTWKERLDEIKTGEAHTRSALGPLENDLLRLISESPKSKHELIEALYPEKSSFSALEERLKNLLSRLRKKFPALILFQDGKYRFAEETFLDRSKLIQE